MYNKALTARLGTTEIQNLLSFILRAEDTGANGGTKPSHNTAHNYDTGRETHIYAEGTEGLNDHCSIDAYSFVGGRARRELALGDDAALVLPHEQPRLRRRRLHLNPNSTITKRKLPIRC